MRRRQPLAERLKKIYNADDAQGIHKPRRRAAAHARTGPLAPSQATTPSLPPS